ncbi:transferase [Bifidobacterium callitrichos DSM 23973]|uniref:Transferase n=2 Tax=Bifidobacterium callitrichos TaxID=762209 RepID=A0A087A7C5_9BIFI|nr:transferase [Bifidobacterium callitrichos DSM 23973]
MFLKKYARRLILGPRADSEFFINFLRKKGAIIGEGTYFYDPRSNCIGLNNYFNLVIGNNVNITHGVVIVDHGYDWSVLKCKYGEVIGNTGQVTIGNNVFIGMNAVILKNVTIGDNVIIGAGSIVNRDIPSNSVAAGSPCRVIESIDTYRAKRKQVQLDEAYNLYCAFINRYPNTIPNQDIFREYFWLFDRPGCDGHLSSPVFDEVMHLVNGTYDCSIQAIKNSSPAFDSYEDFLIYCSSRYFKYKR